MIQETFLSHLFFGKKQFFSPILVDLSIMPVNKSGLGILNPVISEQEKYLITQRRSAELVWDMAGGGGLSNHDHIWKLGEERRDINKDREAKYKTKIKGLVCNLKGTNRRLILRTKSTGTWPSVRGTTVSGTVLSAMEFRDFLCAHYNVSPLNPQSHYDRCGTDFGVT